MEENAADRHFETGTVPFPDLALYLAETYGQMQKDLEYLKTVIDAGVPVYTEEQAIRDLTAVSVNYDSERVQTSAISNVPHRIAELLDSGYVRKMNFRYRAEFEEAVAEHTYLCWKTEIVETAMRERMNTMEQEVFERLYVRGKSYRQICRAYRKGTLHNKRISRLKNSAVRAVEEQLRNSSCFPANQIYIKMLLEEKRRDAAENAEKMV